MQLVEEALNLDPEDGAAYVVALMARHQCHVEPELGAVPTPKLDQESDYKKAVRFGSEDLGQRLADYDRAAKALASTTGADAFLKYVRWDGERPLTQREQDLLASTAARMNEKARLESEERKERDRVAARTRELRTRADRILSAWDSASPGRALGWRILHIHETQDRALITTNGCVAAMPFDGNAWPRPTAPTEWEHTAIRQWLNDDFYRSLPPEFRSHIATVSTDGTPDRVTLLSADDLAYFGGSEQYRHQAISTSLYWEIAKDEQPGSNWASHRQNPPRIGWWLRAGTSPLEDKSYSRSTAFGAPRVIEDGHTYTRQWEDTSRDDGYWKRFYLQSASSTLGVRPALWLDLSDPATAGAQPEAVDRSAAGNDGELNPLVGRARSCCLEGRFSPRTESFRLSSKPDLSRAALTDADSIVRLALDLNPADADAHVTALMVETRSRTEAELGTVPDGKLSASSAFQTALEHAAEPLQQRLREYDRQARENHDRLPAREAAARRVEAVLNQPIVDSVRTASAVDIRRRHGELDSRRGDLLNALASLESQTQAATSERDSLGMFASKRKRDLDGLLAKLKGLVNQTRGDLRDVEETMASVAQDARRIEDEERAVQDSAIKWRALHVDDAASRVLVTTTQSVAKLPYRSDVAWEDVTDENGTPIPGRRQLKAADTTWATSSLRRWLNEDFFDALPDSTASIVIEVENQNSPAWEKSEGEPTTDKVFLLSTDEAASRSNLSGTEMAVQNVGQYWLRSHSGGNASIMGGMNGINTADVTKELDVRPHMWVKL